MGSNIQIEKIVLFDGVCNLCSTSVQFIIRHNKHADIKFTSLQSEFGQSMLSRFQLSSEVKTIVFIKGGKAFLRSDAALEVCKELNGFYPFFRFFKIIPTSIRDWVYNLIAKNRYQWFGKKDQCWIPTPELRNRFIS
jgi:predicted DCC family thiol-disulfide oxidoreductase YuxK